MRSQFPFVLSESQRGALVVLLLVLLSVLGVRFISDPDEPAELDFTQTEYYQRQLDSLREQQKVTQRETYTYNPNYLSDYNAYRLGIPLDAYDQLQRYRASGKYVNSLTEFQSITGVTDSVKNVLSSSLRFPNFKSAPKKKAVIKKQDLNTVDAAAFEKISGIGPTLSKRIVNYREYLSGFSFAEQCYEVYGLDSLVVNRLLQYFEIQTPAQIHPTNINSASLDELARLPYLSRKDAEKIVAFRTQNNGISPFFLSELFVDSPNKLARIKLYLY